MPSYYKYRSLYRIGDNGKREPAPYTKSIFEKAELWYSAPKDVNDPFDCKFKLHVADSTDAEWEEYYDKLIRDYPIKTLECENAKTIKIWRTSPALVKNIGVDTFKDHYEDSSIYCFSKRKNSIPMFSYYADEHRGIAIEFQFSHIELPCGIPIGKLENSKPSHDGKIIIGDVKYPSTFPELNYHRLRGQDQLVYSLIFTKYFEWNHEDEFRIFRRKIPASAVQFDRKLLTKVIFGCRTTKADVDLVKGWLSGWPSDVVLSKAEPASDRFEMLINDFDLVKAT